MNNCYTFSIDKYKSADVAGISKHNLRDLNDISQTINIDPSRSKNNLHFDFVDFKPTEKISSDVWKENLNSILRKDNEKQTIKKSTNVFLNMNFSASPQYFFDGLNEKNLEEWDQLKWENPQDRKKISEVWKTLNKEKFENWKNSVLEFIKNEEDFKNLGVSLDLHLDEKTPHFEFSLCPKVGNKVDCKNFFTPTRLEKWRSKLDLAFKPLGLDRLKDEAPATKDDYKAIAEASRPVVVPEPPRAKAPKAIKDDEIFEDRFFGKKQIIETEKILENRNKREKAYNTELKFYKTYFEENKFKIGAYEKLKEKYNTEKKENNKMRQQIKKLTTEQVENLRSIDCNEVLHVLGFNPKKEGITHRTKTEDLNLVVNSENKFTENKNQIYGGGAIDLMTKVFKYTFKEATDFLSSHFGFDRVSQVILTNQKQTEETVKNQLKISAKYLPTPKPQNLDKIKIYLTEKRGINKELVEDLISKGQIYADGKNNCVFPNAEKTFSFSRGTYEEKRFVCCNGEMDFLKYDFNSSKTNEIYLFESSIDALSYRTLNPQKNGLYVVLNGSALINRVQELGIDKFSKVHLCFDNDEQGQKFCAKIKDQTISACEIHQPKGKDFNEDLKNGNYTKQLAEKLAGRDQQNATATARETKPVEPNPTERNQSTRRRFPR